MAYLEHVNITVPNPKNTAEHLITMFGWKIRWQGTAMHGGFTVHVGTEDQYIALYAPVETVDANILNYKTQRHVNHIGLIVDDLDLAEAKVIARGFTPQSHADYEPGRRFYFVDEDSVEYELISYA